MTDYGYTSLYLTKNQKPWFPIMGEIHYSRYPRQYWKESIYKMKAGGVEIISSYVVWIHHEEEEGVYDFEQDRDLRAFIQTVQECGMKMILRIGPWAHGEIRNGGFPDWLMKKEAEGTMKLRINDPNYLKLVEKYYQKIFEQAEGLLDKDGGPVIGLQLENEYGHVGGLQGEEGERHMRTLWKLANQAGFDVQLVTATGWGGAVTGGAIPVMGGYCDAPWDQRLTEIEPSGNYIFTPERNDHNIGSDYGFGHGITFDWTKFPFLTAELGGGLQVTHHRRPVSTGKDVGAMSLVKMGSGCNLLGYYMYHGGTNPDGKRSTLQESRETGYPNDLPIKSYDFNAPIREFGQLSDSYREIRLLASFIHDFGEELCRMEAYFPKDNPLHPSQLSKLRYSVRHNGKSGYVFVNNYQRRRVMAEHKQRVFSVTLEDKDTGKKNKIIFPPVDIKNGEFFFFPFCMPLGKNALLKTALASPLCRLNENTWVFYGDRDPQFETEGNMEGITLLCLSREEALNASKIKLDKEYLIISSSDVILMEDGIHIQGIEKTVSFRTYPELTETPNGFLKETENGFGIYTKKIENISDYAYDLLETDVPIEPVSVSDAFEDENPISERGADEKTLAMRKRRGKHFLLTLPEQKQFENDKFLRIQYQGDRYEIRLNGKLISDHFYTGQTAEVGLKRFGFPRQLFITVYPYEKNDPVYLEKIPQMKNNTACSIEKVTAVSQWDVLICIKQKK